MTNIIMLHNINYKCVTRISRISINPYPAKLIYLNFQPLKIVSRYREPQLQVAENYSYLFNMTPDICKS